jgi:hypothetical protein
VAEPTPEDLSRDLLRDLATCDAATLGPWRVYGQGEGGGYAVGYSCGGRPAYGCHIEDIAEEADARMVAEARTGWPAALRRLIAAEAENKRLRSELDGGRKARDLLAKGMESQAELTHDLKQQARTLEAEVARLKRGDFTDAELQDLCHNMPPDSLGKFKRGCEDYSAKLFGLKPPASEEERRLLKARYAGQVEPCCECGNDYPRGDLKIDGEIFCAKCREDERQSAERRHQEKLRETLDPKREDRP